MPAGVHATGVVAASPDGRTLAYGDDSGAIRLVDAERGVERGILSHSRDRLLASSPSPRMAGAWPGAAPAAIRCTSRSGIWSSGKLVHRLGMAERTRPPFDGRVTRLHAGRESIGRRGLPAVGGLRLGPDAGQQIARLSHDQVYGLSFSPDGKSLVTAGWDSVIRFWGAENGELRREVKVDAHEKAGDLRMYAVCHAPEGGVIATAHLDGMVRVWQADR